MNKQLATPLEHFFHQITTQWLWKFGHEILLSAITHYLLGQHVKFLHGILCICTFSNNNLTALAIRIAHWSVQSTLLL